MELSRRTAWDSLSRKCTDADMEALMQLALRLGRARGPEASGWLLKLASDEESAEKICLLIATAVAELRIRREEIRETVERN